MGQLVMATQAGLGSGLPALRHCSSAMKPIFSGELKAVGARHSASARRGRGRCAQPSSSPRTARRTRGGGLGLLSPHPGMATRAEPQSRVRGGMHVAAHPGMDGVGPHPALGSFS